MADAPTTSTEVTEDTAVVRPTTPPSPVPTAGLLVADADDDENVSAFKLLLSSFTKELGRVGTIPEQFKKTAAVALQVTNYVLQYPRVPVLDLYLAFIVENKTGICAGNNYLQGVTTLGQVDQSRVGYLYNLFYDIANQTAVRVNSAQALRVLGKPEIINYYDRKIAMLSYTSSDEQ